QLSSPSGLQIDSSGRLIVANFGSAAITLYASAATANGNIAPSATINGSNTKLSTPSQIPVASGSHLFIAEGSAASILVCTNVTSANGDSAPNDVITGANTGLARSSGGTGPATATGIAVDPTR